MRPNIVIHIGPPKTATTSLQIALDEVSCPDFFYAGTFQPRTRNSGSLCQALYQACLGPSEGLVNALEIRDELKRLNSEGKTVFLSEEMFLLEQEEVSIKDKIVSLSKALSGFDCRILISARPGKSALPSLYQQIFNSLPLKLQMDFSAFCHDGRAMCYDYKAVCDMLRDAGFNDIIFFEFKDLSKKELSLGTLIACDEFEEYEISIQQHNVGVYGKSVSERVLPKVSMKNLGNLKLTKWLVKSLHLRKWPGYRRLIEVLDRVALRPSGNDKLIVPEDVACRLDEAYLEAVSRYGRKITNSGVVAK